MLESCLTLPPPPVARSLEVNKQLQSRASSGVGGLWGAPAVSRGTPPALALTQLQRLSARLAGPELLPCLAGLAQLTGLSVSIRFQLG